MVKHNNAICKSLRRKSVHAHVKTWLNQPARAVRRREARKEKLRQAGTGIVNQLRPAVRCQGQKYNYRVRAGRGFTPEELKAAGLSAQVAKAARISIDQRRRNRNKDTFQRNVNRLIEAKKHLVGLPKLYAHADAPTSAEGKTVLNKWDNTFKNNTYVLAN